MSEDNEHVVRTIFSSGTSDFDSLYTGIGIPAVRKKVKCIWHLKENKDKDMKLKSMKIARDIYIKNAQQ